MFGEVKRRTIPQHHNNSQWAGLFGGQRWTALLHVGCNEWSQKHFGSGSGNLLGMPLDKAREVGVGIGLLVQPNMTPRALGAPSTMKMRGSDVDVAVA